MSVPCNVSVLVPAYNAELYIAEAVDSVLAQKIDGLELIVVDDGSKDRTRAILESYAARSDLVILSHPNGANRGTCATRRLALGAARGKFIAFLDSDDRYLPGKLSRHLAILQAHPEVVLVHGPVLADELTRAQGGNREAWFNLDTANQAYHPADSTDFFQANRVCNSTVVCRRSALSQDDLPPSMALNFEDWLLWTIMAGRGPFYYDPEPLTVYRFHDGSLTAAHWERPGHLELAHIEYLAALLGRLPDARGRRRVGRILAGEILRLAQMEGNRAKNDSDLRFSAEVLDAMLRPIAADWLIQRRRSSFAWRLARRLKHAFRPASKAASP